jgi:hypothetical protein
MDRTMRALRVIAARQAALAPHGFTKEYVYALVHGVYPLLSEDDGRDPFDGGYSIERSFVEGVLEVIARAWLDKEPITFTRLEDRFGQRMALVAVLRYAHLAERFVPEVFERLLADCPGEARSIMHDWSVLDHANELE